MSWRRRPRDSRRSHSEAGALEGQASEALGRKIREVLDRGRLSSAIQPVYFFAWILAANVWTAILPFLTTNVSVANTISADAQLACQTM